MVKRSVGVEVKAVVASHALCDLIVVDFHNASVAESAEVRHGGGLAAQHRGQSVQYAMNT
eukprot:1572496-Pleurochrysis_carterae.AAC.1